MKDILNNLSWVHQGETRTLNRTDKNMFYGQEVWMPNPHHRVFFLSVTATFPINDQSSLKISHLMLLSVSRQHANLSLSMVECDLRCIRRAAMRCAKQNCCGIPGLCKSGSWQIISWWDSLGHLMVQGGQHEEKRWRLQKRSSLLHLRRS